MPVPRSAVVVPGAHPPPAPVARQRGRAPAGRAGIGSGQRTRCPRSTDRMSATSRQGVHTGCGGQGAAARSVPCPLGPTRPQTPGTGSRVALTDLSGPTLPPVPGTTAPERSSDMDAAHHVRMPRAQPRASPLSRPVLLRRARCALCPRVAGSLTLRRSRWPIRPSAASLAVGTTRTATARLVRTNRGCATRASCGV
jgi:hypothetical protein